MSIWGKIIGGTAGFALGGPLGALVGAVAGHAVDRMRKARQVTPGEQRQAAFTVAVIALSAKMAKADGRVTRDEVDTFKRIFHIPPHELPGVGELFDLARREAAGFEPYARQVAELFHDSPEVLEELLDGLLEIAMADKVIHPAELDYMRRVAEIFGISGHAFERLRATHAAPGEQDPYLVLGVTRQAGDDEIKRTYRRLARENHPDKLIAKGMPQEFIDLANDKLAAINGAYDRIRRERGLK